MSLKDEVEEIQKKADNLEKGSFAMDILEDYKMANKRMFIALILVLFMWLATIGYLVYTLNDIGKIETTTTQEIEDVDSIDNSNIVNGDLYGENKTNSNNN